MSLSKNISDLTGVIARELKTRIEADHPGVARAWVCFGVGANRRVVVKAAWNVRNVVRLAKGKYRVEFVIPMPDTGYCWHAHGLPLNWIVAMSNIGMRIRGRVKTPEFLEVNCGALGLPSDASEISVTVWR